MIYRQINSSIVITSVIERFNITDSDWIPRSNSIINKCLSDLKITKYLEKQSIDLPVTEYKFELPCDLKSVKCVSIDGERIEKSTSLVGINESGILTYELLNNNFGILLTDDSRYKECTITLEYKGFTMELDTDYNLYFPIIPDNQDVIEAMSFYILINILQRGYKHSVYSLESNSPVTNPHYIYYGVNNKSGLRKKARLSIGANDVDTERGIVKRVNTFLYSQNEYFTSEFKK